MFRKFILLAALLGTSLGAFAAQQELPFRSGETFDLRLMYKWGGVNKEVGTARVKLDSVSYQGNPTYYAQFTARSSKLFDAFYKIREHFHSWFDAGDLRPRKFIRETLEGKYAAYNLYHYDWNRRVIDADVNMNKPQATHMEIPLRKDVYDLPALIYHIRTLDPSKMVKGQKIPLTFAIDDAVFDVVMTYRGTQTLKIRKVGYLDTYRFSCTVVDGALFEGDKELEFWFSSDDNHLPVAVMAPLRVGAVWAWFKGAKGLKYNLPVREQV